MTQGEGAAVKLHREGMDYSWFWLIISAYKMELIDRKKFISLWQTVRYMSDERKERKQTEGRRREKGIPDIR